MSAAFLDLYLDQFLIFVLVLTRLSALFLLAPLPGMRSAPMRIRALLAVALSILVTPLHWDALLSDVHSLLQLAGLMSREALLGLAMALAVSIMFAGVQLAGAIMGQLSGMQLADVFDPNFNTSTPLFSQLIDLLAMAVFVLIGGHREVLESLLEMFRWMPPGQAQLPATFATTLAEVMTRSFALGIRVAAPVMISLLASVLILGLISRTLPQLNILAVGFSLNSMVLISTLLLSLSGLVWLMDHEGLPLLQAVRSALTPLAPP